MTLCANVHCPERRSCARSPIAGAKASPETKWLSWQWENGKCAGFVKQEATT